MHLQLRPSVCGSSASVCVCECVLACKCNYNGPGHSCVAYFEAYFLAAKRQLQPHSVCIWHQITNDALVQACWQRGGNSV